LNGGFVASVSVSTNASDGVGLDIELTTDGLARFNALAQQLYGAVSPQNEVAVVVDGRVVSAPRFNTNHFDSAAIRVSGGFTDARARELAAAIGPVRNIEPTFESRFPGAEARMSAALAAWSTFPVNASPRPLVVIPGREIVDPPGGFRDNASKDAYSAGAFVPPASYPSGPATASGLPIISARDAFARLKAAGTPPPAATSLAITGVRFGTATFLTDRGPVALPAWLFSLRGVANPAAVLAVGPSAQFTPPSPEQPAPAGGSNGRLVSVGARGSSEMATLTILFGGSAPGPGPCSHDYEARVMESPTAVVVTVAESRLPTVVETGAPNAVCADVAHSREASVVLSAPLGARVVVDVVTGQPISAVQSP
jgi:hypothetical protein